MPGLFPVDKIMEKSPAAKGHNRDVYQTVTKKDCRSSIYNINL